MELTPKLAKTILAGLKTIRSLFEATWQEIIDYCLPQRAPVIGTPVPGEKRGRKIYDSEPGRAMMKLAANLNALLTDPNTQWFGLITDDEEANKQPDVIEWLEKTEKRMKKALDQSNFGTAVHEFYIDLAGINTAVMYIEESKTPGKDLAFSTRHIREVYFAENAEGVVDAIYREILMEARKIIQRWGKDEKANIPAAATKAFDAGETEKLFPILHVIEPRLERDDGKADILNMPYKSMWIDVDGDKIVKESGYPEFPFAIGRWSKSSGEDYGRGPGFEALADIKSLNSMAKTMLRTGQKVADPPLNVPDTMEGTADLTPGGINFFDARTPEAKVAPIKIGADLPITRDMINDKKNSIRESFYVTQMQLIDVNDMTAEEVRQRTAENMRVLGPTFGRLQPEFLETTVLRCYGILFRAGKIPEPPKLIKEKNLKIKYISPLAKAQLMHEVQAITYTAETLLLWYEKTQNQNHLDLLDWDAAARKIADLDGTPLELLVDQKKVMDIRKKRKDLMMKQLKLEMAKTQAAGLKDVAGAGLSAAKSESMGGGPNV